MTRPINCDQVAWMLAAIGRYLPQRDTVRVSRARDLQQYALLYELMDVAELHFADDLAARNGTPRDVSMLREKSPNSIDAGRSQASSSSATGGMVAGGLVDCPEQLVHRFSTTSPEVWSPPGRSSADKRKDLDDGRIFPR